MAGRMKSPSSSEQLVNLARMYLEDVGDRTSRARLVGALSRDDAIERADVVDRATGAIAADNEVDHQRMVAYAARRITTHQSTVAALEALRAGAAADPSHLAEVEALLEEPLSMRLLSDHVFAHPEIERLITVLRTRWLEATALDATQASPSRALLAAVALQMHTTEWIYSETAAEGARIDVLADYLRGSRTVDLFSVPLLVYATYRPLASLGMDETLVAMTDGRTDRPAQLVRRHLVDPIEESTLAARLPHLTEVVDPVSVAVRSQYEEQPYPRWRTTPARKPRSFGDTVAKALGNPDLAATLRVDAPQILVAGCGTGRHAVAAASRYAGARVLAVDLSVRSLAYGALRAQHLGISNVEFAHGDILGLAEIGRSFDVVECVGVLHHLADPEAGWASLRRVTRRGGFMKIGLYSRHGRSFLDPITRIIDERGLEPTVEGIRAVRDLVVGVSVDTPARAVMAAPDFYSRSGCRDLFFHAHEDRFDLPRIRRALDMLNLEFLGFELPTPRIRQIYLQWFPDDTTGRALSNWDLLERRYPAVFSTMYRFWARTVE